MEHKLRVLVRLDVDPSSAVLEVSGCLTADSCRSLPPLIRKTASLVRGHRITVDLAPAHHIEREAVAFLRENAGGRDFQLRIDAPDLLPGCPSLNPAAAGVKP